MARSEGKVKEPERSGRLGFVTRRQQENPYPCELVCRESEGFIVAKKRDSARGAKGPCCCHVEFS